ncbi:MAG: hypothetical protein IKJ99_00570 [Oscillospiraceae bacterium]|nr:hypothetical protein [Oscillospiraceae bacterium]
MKDFPVFTTEYGVASLTLREIPYRGEAFILIQDSLQPEELLKECISFCRVVGAEKIYARGHEHLKQYPLHCIIYEMRADAAVDESKVESLWPVTEETIGPWREFMNEKMRPVDNSGTLEKKGEQEILDSGGAYFVHRKGELLGAGWVVNNEILLVASAKPGMGERVMHTLMSLLPGDEIKLTVVSTNDRAIRLYEKLGFLKTAESRRWYRVF